MSARLLAHIKKAPGSRMEQLAAAIGATTRELMRPSAKLLESGASRKKGVKRNTQNFVK